MKRKIKITTQMVKKTVLWVLIVTLGLLFGYVIIDSYNGDRVLSDSTIPEAVNATGEYKEYLDSFPNAKYPKVDDIVIDGVGYDKKSDSFYEESFSGDAALVTTEIGEATWGFYVEQEGFYNIIIDYIAVPGGGANIERKIKINGKVPYANLENVSFQRVWGDGGKKIVDIVGNEIRPTQMEIVTRRTQYVKDQVGYVTEPFLVYLEEGNNEITIESIREPMAIFNIFISSKESYKTYEEVKAEYEANGYKKVTGGITGVDATLDPNETPTYKIEGENSTIRSSSTLYAISDRTSAYTSPSDPVKTILNTIGGSKWTTPGDWITWEVKVPEDGLYNISLRAKQSDNRGLFSTRKVYIDGKIPFAEAQNAKFVYSTDWRIVTLGTEKEPFYFYLTAGTHQITLESTLGDYGSEINKVNEIIDELTALYRRIISITGANPDKYIDYKLTTKIPNLLESFEKAADDLITISNRITEISGEKSSESASLERMAIQLRRFVKKPRLIQQNLRNFSDNISSLGTWVITVSSQPLTIDYLMVHSDDFKLPKANPNFFVGTWFGIRSFVKSFYFDYASIGITESNLGKTTVEVWFLTSTTAGREQANAIRTLIDSTFSNVKDINIDLKVVSPDTLLTATLAGRGPDVAINADNGLPINYAMRGAIKDLSGFNEFNEVKSWFQESAMVPYEYDGKYYALPNTQSFLMTFYRTDIFEEQKWSVPQTWEDVINLIPELQIKNLQFYLPLNTVGSTSVVNQIFASRLYQTGGTFYRTKINSLGKEYMESNFDSEEGMAAFEFWCQFYTDYSFSLSITANTFINRFRSGEMPIGIASYDTYNTLAVSAPEIRGKWKFAVIPGTRQQDGTIDHSGAASGTAVVMMEQTKVPNESWEFMKWWVSEDTQVAYAREIEAILGSAARHPTANVEAFKQLAWTIEEQQALLAQWEVTVGVPEVPGGYYTGRNLENAFRQVVNGNLNPRDTLESKITLINRELDRKRKEFGLGVSDEGRS